MNAHRSLQRTDVLKYPAEKIALMVASEFWRAEGRAAYPVIVEGCFRRARELMGILETVDLDPEAAAQLAPIYVRCTERRLLAPEPIPPADVERLSRELAAAFEEASRALGRASHA